MLKYLRFNEISKRWEFCVFFRVFVSVSGCWIHNDRNYFVMAGIQSCIETNKHPWKAKTNLKWTHEWWKETLCLKWVSSLAFLPSFSTFQLFFFNFYLASNLFFLLSDDLYTFFHAFCFLSHIFLHAYNYRMFKNTVFFTVHHIFIHTHSISGRKLNKK